MDISKLLERLQNNEEQAFKELVYSFSARLMTITRIYAQSEADAKDTLQDTYMVVYRKIKDFKGTEDYQLYGWIKRIIINISLSKSQRKYRHLESSLDALKVDKGFDENTIGKLTHDELMEVIFNLPNDYRQVFALHVIEGYSHKEISAMLKISISNSKVLLFRSKKLLKAKIDFSNKIVTA